MTKAPPPPVAAARCELHQGRDVKGRDYVQITSVDARDGEALVNYLRRRGAHVFDDCLETGKTSTGEWSARWYFESQSDAVTVFNITAAALGRATVQLD